MTKTIQAIPAANLETVRGGVGSGPNRNWSISSGFGAVLNGQGQSRSDQTYAQDQVMQACKMANTSSRGTVDQAAAGKCFLDTMRGTPQQNTPAPAANQGQD